jgi:MtN3 and saliva related transmembrane protein
MIKPEVLGYIAALVTTASFAPQAWLVWKTRNVEGVSLGMYTIISIGLSLWLAYGVMIDSLPVIAANAATLSLSLFILAMKLRYGAQGEAGVQESVG